MYVFRIYVHDVRNMYENPAMSTLKWHQEKIYSVYKKYMAVPAGLIIYLI